MTGRHIYPRRQPLRVCTTGARLSLRSPRRTNSSWRSPIIAEARSVGGTAALRSRAARRGGEGAGRPLEGRGGGPESTSTAEEGGAGKGGRLGPRIRVGEGLLAPPLAVGFDGLADLGVLEAENLASQEGSINGAGLADGERSDRHSPRHLNRRE